MDTVITEDAAVEAVETPEPEVEVRELAPGEVLEAGAHGGPAEEIAAAAEDAPAEPAMERPWQGLLMVEGEPTSDGRVFNEMTWRDLPLTLMWQRETSHGGMQAGGEFVVGRIDTIERVGSEIRGTGVFDLASEEGAEVVRLFEGGFLSGVSIEAAPNDGTIEYDEENDQLIITGAEIGAAAVVPFPAFRDAQIELLEAVTASVHPALHVAEAVVASAEGERPPREWFENPNLPARMGLHVEENGRVYGHIYGWGECHQGFANRCVQIARGGSYRYIVGIDGRGVRTADGSFVQTGPLSISADHAATNLSWLAAKDHYAHTALAAADVVCGEDEHGIWVAGMVRPGTPPELQHALTASAPSGDWRLVGGRLELVAILMVNMPGFPAFASARAPHVVAASFSGGEATALIVQGAAPEHAASGCGCGGTGESPALSAFLDRLGQFESAVRPLVESLRSAEADRIVAELDALAAEEPTEDPAPRSLAEILAEAAAAPAVDDALEVSAPPSLADLLTPA